ncbi:MAG: YicC family protein [Methylophilaceae bacterium]|nr:YicC family protein [Methylophilaceae bacterium]
MTGFAAVEREIIGGVLLIELRSVNHRYLELHLKLDDTMRSFEPQVRELMSAKLGRGKVECRLSVMPLANSAKTQQLNHEVLQQLAELTQTAQVYFPQSQPVNLLDVLSMPGVMISNSINIDDLANTLTTALTEALQALVEARMREGEKLKALLFERLTEAEQLVAKVKPLLPQLIKNYQEKLTTKFQETLNTIDDERIRQELSLFAQKMDVDEELTRLTAHFSEVKRNLNGKGAAGKRLDFLMQELNREANTLGSKSVSTETSQVSIELKVLIEQMREQIQNIE